MGDDNKTDDETTQQIPAETLRECAAYWREQLAAEGLVS